MVSRAIGRRTPLESGRAELWRSDFDISVVARVGGACISTNGQYMYVVDDTPRNHACFYAFEKKTMRRIDIEITRITSSGYKPRRGVGYGDWVGIDMSMHPTDDNRRCIVIADIGNSTYRGKQHQRNDDQPMRLLYIDEPSPEELASSSIRKAGEEYPVAYMNECVHHSQAMAIVGELIFIVTQNRQDDHRSYVYTCAVASLDAERTTPLLCIGQMTLDFSEVTDVIATKQFIALRTYIGINFYAVADMHAGVDASARACLRLMDLKKEGRQEAMGYDAHDQRIVLLGHGCANIYTVQAATIAFQCKRGRAARLPKAGGKSVGRSQDSADR